MPILNATKHKILAEKYRLCKSEFSKLKGLMFTRKYPYALLFDMAKEKIVNLHMFCVFYPIDVLWLDSNKRIVHLKKRFVPFTFTLMSRKARYIIELENGTINRTKTSVGDTVKFK